MKRAIDTIVHDQADGPVPADKPALESPPPETAPAADAPAAGPAETSTIIKRRRGGGE
ncbi:hypothetical protein [Azospirillum humicireducens]|uniref:hypothetical protein n=1 Tax=Azospirillum humicireducens TaxID=1226968 RepID=UPI001304F101|nr:hypothetical protein [Azospirillum humicireducens]